ncbi:hypothetical protein So717_20800 [Roseobacter cerasinus]|uniref:Lipocalin/cytosolic fatty-acid binding domain-containing protein n=1 Tax=Roseobacter cerasinus TaxID=2602289 RepID=A0A640VRA5_9RHOB|nr:lipocalin family protein [Roseobacter cerasinus]GFE50327.1 hypothetical protein So717_20800 [Roseobacter cerasinus]
MKRLARGLALFLLAACASESVPGFRDTSVPITATTRFSPQSFSGRWQVIAAYPSALFPSCAGQQWFADLDAEPAQLTVRCGSSGVYEVPVAVDARGVLQLESAELNRPARAFWVMWMDEEARTAVVGTPGGELGWILNRDRALRPDRLEAAREIMAFNGYDVTRLQRAEP